MMRNLSMALLCAGLMSTLAAAQTRPVDEVSDTSSVRLLRDLVAGPTSQIATVMFSTGVRNCAARIDQISNFLTKDTRSSALLFLPEREPDNSMVSVSLEVQGTGIPRAYGSATFSPNTAIGCSAMYESVQFWPESCNAVAAKHFKGAVATGSLGGEIAMFNIGPAARVFLMRATASSCVSIKKEIIK